MASLLFADIIFIAAYLLSTGYEHCLQNLLACLFYYFSWNSDCRQCSVQSAFFIDRTKRMHDMRSELFVMVKYMLTYVQAVEVS